MKYQDKSRKPSELYKHVKQHRIPIYETGLEVIVTDDIEGVIARAKLNTNHLNPAALTTTLNDWTSLVFNGKAKLTHNTIAHEMLHCVAQTMESVGGKFDSRWHEEYAYLIGYLTELVYKDLNEWRIRVG